MAFTVSTAKVVITPAAGANPYMAGYGVQGIPRVVASNTPFSQPLYARCVVLWDNGYPNAIISLDILGLPRGVHQAVRPRLVQLANWASSDIVVVATHTHNGPVIGNLLDPYIAYNLSNLGLVNSYTTWLQDRIVAVVKSALAAARTTVTLDYRTTSMNFAFNRVGLPTVETVVPVLTARRSNGTPARGAVQLRLPPGQRRLAGTVGRRLARRGVRRRGGCDRSVRPLHPRPRR